jgi:hypothetical protein
VSRLFALDHNFPTPIVEVLVDFQADADLVRVDQIDPAMADLDDWEVLLALHLDDRPWDGLITTDSSMLQQPLELAVLMQTKLTLVAVKDAGHNPVKACGLLFAHLAGVCKRTRPDKAQIWTPAAVERPHTDPWAQLENVADHRNEAAVDLYAAHKLADGQLADWGAPALTPPHTDAWDRLALSGA